MVVIPEEHLRSLRSNYKPFQFDHLASFTICEVPFGMVIVTRRHLERAAEEYKDAANELMAWAVIVSKVRWRNFAEVRASFPDADAANGFVVFNVRHNRYRLITHIHYAKDDPNKGSTRGHCYIRSFLTHAEYNDPANWDKEFSS